MVRIKRKMVEKVKEEEEGDLLAWLPARKNQPTRARPGHQVHKTL